MQKRILVCLTIIGALAAFPVWALDLHQARAAGMIGEKNDGYVTALKPDDEVNALAAEVNAKRQAEYARISGQNGQPAAVVAQLAAAQIIIGLESGAPYQDAGGAWKTK